MQQKLEATVEAAEKHGLSKEYLHSKSKNISCNLKKIPKYWNHHLSSRNNYLNVFKQRFEDAENSQEH